MAKHVISYSIERWAGNYGPRETITATCSCGEDLGEIWDIGEAVKHHRDAVINKMLALSFEVKHVDA